MEIKYFIDSNVKTQHTVEQILTIIDQYKKKYNIETELRSVQLNPQFDVEGIIAWIIGEVYMQFNEEQIFDYVVSDKTGIVEYILMEHGPCYPHLEKEKTPEEIAQEKADDEAYLQELRDAGVNVTE